MITHSETFKACESSDQTRGWSMITLSGTFKRVNHAIKQ
jgi:hypothetical protein